MQRHVRRIACEMRLDEGRVSMRSACRIQMAHLTLKAGLSLSKLIQLGTKTGIRSQRFSRACALLRRQLFSQIHQQQRGLIELIQHDLVAFQDYIPTHKTRGDSVYFINSLSFSIALWTLPSAVFSGHPSNCAISTNFMPL